MNCPHCGTEVDPSKDRERCYLCKKLLVIAKPISDVSLAAPWRLLIFFVTLLVGYKLSIFMLLIICGIAASFYVYYRKIYPRAARDGAIAFSGALMLIVLFYTCLLIWLANRRYHF